MIEKGKKCGQDAPVALVGNAGIAIAVWQLLDKEFVVGGILLAASISLLSLAIRYAYKNNVVIHCRARSEVTTFFQRKKDDIFITVLAAIFGDIVTYLVGKYAP